MSSSSAATNPFRIRAYRRAARNLETLSEDVDRTLERARRLGVATLDERRFLGLLARPSLRR